MNPACFVIGAFIVWKLAQSNQLGQQTIENIGVSRDPRLPFLPTVPGTE